MQTATGFLSFLVLMGLPIAVPEATASEPTARELLEGTDDLHRGASSQGRIRMHVKSARWERTLTMDIWSQGEERSLIRIVEPAKEAGTSTLKVDDNIWNYLPKVDRTLKVPAGMMSGSWMGSHFTNDDLVKESRMAEDYTYEIVAGPEGEPGGLYVIECIPKPDAPVVWGKLVVRVRADDRLPVDVTYWDEDGRLVRTMVFEDVREIGGRTLPCTMRLVPADAPEEYTELVYEDILFDLDIPASTFTLQSLGG